MIDWIKSRSIKIDEIIVKNDFGYVANYIVDDIEKDYEYIENNYEVFSREVEDSTLYVYVVC